MPTTLTSNPVPGSIRGEMAQDGLTSDVDTTIVQVELQGLRRCVNIPPSELELDSPVNEYPDSPTGVSRLAASVREIKVRSLVTTEDDLITSNIIGLVSVCRRWLCRSVYGSTT